MTAPPRFVTIGVYGYEEETFFQTLQAAGVDTFCDLRQRRGVRGARYAFANSQRLQRRLAEMGIRYVHHKELAPTKAIRALQEVADKAEKVPRRQRRTLGAAFKAAYREEILGDFDAAAFVAGLPAGAAVVALFCVEGEPAACHRSLLAEKLQGELAVEVEHLVP